MNPFKEQTITRLLNLVDRFLKGERLSTKEIENIYNVSLRTAQRYIVYLREAGFNIKKEKTKYYLDFGVDEEILEEFANKLGLEGMPILNKIKENVFYSKSKLYNKKISLKNFIKNAKIKNRRCFKAY